MKELLEAGVHFGHQTRRWDPRMKPYIFTERNGIHIIDLQRTITLLKSAYARVNSKVNISFWEGNYVDKKNALSNLAYFGVP